MEIKTLQDIKDNVSIIYSKHKRRENELKKVYVAAPKKYASGNVYCMFPIEAYIVYNTMAKSESFGTYFLDIKDERAYFKHIVEPKGICLINRHCAYTYRDGTSEIFNDKKIFTELQEAQDYIDKIKKGNIKLEISHITVTTYKHVNGEQIIDSSITI